MVVGSQAVFSPGMMLGRYPQREDSRDGKVEALYDRLVGGYLQWRGARVPSLAAFLSGVSRHGERLAELDDSSLSELAGDLRRRLRKGHFEDAVVMEAFALVREQAGRVLGMRPYDVQIIGGWVMLRGMAAEMQTGEGKTLAATLPACTAALAGIPVHIVTVNDYLVERDAALMSSLYKALGLTVGTITGNLAPRERQQAYACDVTYCTNKQLVFDYLKDRIASGRKTGQLRQQLEGLRGDESGAGLLMRGLCFAIVDEADSVLIDEARTPLLVSRAAKSESQEQFYEQTLELARALEMDRDFVVDLVGRRIELTAAGRETLAQKSATVRGPLSGPRRREAMVRQALVALHLFQRDTHYLVQDGKIQIVDEYTGRLMPDRSWEQGLHQLIEVKEGCSISVPPETLARISYQRFFRRYLHLAGMTGTVSEVAGELWTIYRLRIAAVPTNRPSCRTMFAPAIYRYSAEKWEAVVARVVELARKGQPVLVGTCSVSASEHLGRLLDEAGLAHSVLNARQDRDEAQIVSMAGRKGSVTVATNMAGRGTDIALGPGVAKLGGLHVIATERHDAMRIDRQLAGRSARQGDPGSYEVIMSMEDDLALRYPRSLVLLFFGNCPGRLTGWRALLAGWMLGRAQRAAERHHFRMRRDLLRMDEHLSDMLAFSGRPD